MISRLSSPYILLILATMFWGGNFTVGKSLVSYVPPFTMSLIRWSMALIILLPLAWKELAQTKQIMIKHWKTLIALSLTGIVAFNALAYISVQYTTSINASLVNALSPVLIMLLSLYVLKEKMSKVQILGVFISLVGVIWIITKGKIDYLLSLTFNTGDMIMIFAVLAWAVYSVLMRASGTNLPKTATFFVTILIGVVILAPFAMWETYSLPSWEHLEAPQYLGLLYIGVFPSILSFVFWNKALFIIGPSKASIFLNFIVLFASIFSILFLNEKIYPAQVIGGLLIISGVVLTTNIKLFKSTRGSTKVKHQTKEKPSSS
ncbi:DMT family transporter [Siminovitchia acidinfaciens]|uniref:DMT family transporter n=1 Tax=Siminovitchia acidinfaciens TaxID=2321395 RepID=UPI0013DFC0DD|nr:DMT family transporter [Siminovitchia acidinfaciens]